MLFHRLQDEIPPLLRLIGKISECWYLFYRIVFYFSTAFIVFYAVKTVN